MNIEQQLTALLDRYTVVSVIDLDFWFNDKYEVSQDRLFKQVRAIRRDSYAPNERIVFIQRGDYYVADRPEGIILKNIQLALNEIDISSCFGLVLSTNPELPTEINGLERINRDTDNQLTGLICSGDWRKETLAKHPASNKEIYQYGSSNPINVSLTELTERQQFLLTKSKTFCMYPWIHLHAYPTGEAYPCCHAEMDGIVGDCRTNTLKEIWNSPAQRQLRTDMLSETPNKMCGRCYEQEDAGFFSGRQSANKHHGHHVNRSDTTLADGTVEQFEMTYWDIRFSNLCNLRCRSCGHIFSSQWYQDQIALAGPEWGKKNKVLNYAGRTKTDMWEQLIPHLDFVEQIYWAGGEPILMEEHYRVLEELERRKRFDVRLIYNTNFTEIKLKDRTVFDYWKKFDSVAVGASLDGSGAHGEYIRKGTVWSDVERNRELMLKECPDVDFYISPTLSIMNALHIPKFHQEWVEKGYIRPQDLNINILQGPRWYRIDVATPAYKQRIREAFEEHLAWLRPLDPLSRATVGFESALKFLETDNSDQLPAFWAKTRELDAIRRENILDAIPEMADLLL